MKCHKCGRQISAKRDKCMYCGASADGGSPSTINHSVTKDGNMFISDVHYETDKFQDLPKHVRHKFEDALREGKEAVIIKEESTIVCDPSERELEVPVTISLETVLTLLLKIKNSLEGGRIGHREYNRMAFNIIKDYMFALPEDMHLNFVMNDISNSEFSDYINDDTLKDLRAFVLSSKS